MKNKRITCAILALGMAIGGNGFLASKAYAADNNKLIAPMNNQQQLQNKVCGLLNNIEKNPNEKDIKEARVLLHDIKDSSVKPVYNYLLNLYIDKNIDKGVSSVDELTRAYEKTEKINFCNAKQNITMNLEGKDLSKKEEKVLSQIIPIINSLKLKTDFNMKSIEANKKVQAQGKVNVGINGMNSDIKFWMDINSNSKIPNVKYIIEIPEALKAFVPIQYKGKKYIVYDMEKILKNGQDNEDILMPDFSKVMSSTLDFSNKFTKSFKEFIKVADAKYGLVSRGDINKLSVEEAKNVDKLYKIDLDSDKLVNIIKYALRDKEMSGIVKDFVNNIIALDPSSKGQKITDEQLNKAISSIEGMLEDVKDLVDLDISVNIGVNKDGYIVYNKENVKVSVQSKKIMQLFSKSNPNVNIPNVNSTYTLSFNVDSTINDINKEIKVEAMPEVNKENSINYMEMITDMVPNK